MPLYDGSKSSNSCHNDNGNERPKCCWDSKKKQTPVTLFAMV